MLARCALLLLALSPLLAGCGGSSQDQILGTWAVDVSAMKEEDQYKNASPEERGMMDAMLETMKMQITFTEDKVIMETDVMGQKSSEEKPYTVTSSEGDTLVLSSDDGEITVLVGDDQLTFQDGEESLTLVRKE